MRFSSIIIPCDLKDLLIEEKRYHRIALKCFNRSNYQVIEMSKMKFSRQEMLSTKE